MVFFNLAKGPIALANNCEKTLADLCEKISRIFVVTLEMSAKGARTVISKPQK